jgi:hypothetical protein
MEKPVKMDKLVRLVRKVQQALTDRLVPKVLPDQMEIQVLLEKLVL